MINTQTVSFFLSEKGALCVMQKNQNQISLKQIHLEVKTE